MIVDGVIDAILILQNGGHSVANLLLLSGLTTSDI